MSDPAHKERPRRLHPRLVRGLSTIFGPTLDYPLQPVSVTASRAEGRFWGSRLERHRSRMLPHALAHLSHNVDNFRKASGDLPGPHEGLHWDDSDLFKVMEGMAYALAHQNDPELRDRLESLIAAAAGAQEPDGYLYTARTIDPANPAPGAGPTRWSFMPGSHELYCMGHMIEAAVAHYEVTGRRTFLNVALLTANLLVATFGPDGLRDVCGHEEIELALARLYRTTGDPRFLHLCRFFVDERGQHLTRKSYGEPEQDHLPALEQKEPVGHAVRATYLYCAMTDVAALMDDGRYAMASERLWNEVVQKHLALIGAVGPHHEGEAFGEPYDLQTLDPHNETCASVGLMLWSHRLFLLNLDGKYLDVLERALYNAYLSSHSLEGTAFFYCNPLEADAEKGIQPQRPEWQGCACCPTNVARITPQVPSWAYAFTDSTIYVGLYLQGSAEVSLSYGAFHITQETNYPWEGTIKLGVEADSVESWGIELALRIPGWATGRPVPGDLYIYAEEQTEPFTLEMDGTDLRYRLEKGFAKVRVTGKPGEKRTLELRLPMPVRRVHPHEKFKNVEGKVALERGPLVYCVEGVDHGGNLEPIALPDAAELHPHFIPELLGGVTVLQTGMDSVEGDLGKNSQRSGGIRAVPYYAWNNRGLGGMKVWIPRRSPGHTNG
jgi:uncharacterized protein